MWLLTPGGFYSIVRKEADVADGMVTVRARVREDLDRFLDWYEELGGWGPSEAPSIIESGGTDYKFRVRLPQDDVAAIVQMMVLDIDYSNFKDTIKDNHRHWVYLDVWGALRRLQERWGGYGADSINPDELALHQQMDLEAGMGERPLPKRGNGRKGKARG